MRNTFLIERVNFFISVVFIATFGIFSVAIMFKAANVESPLTTAIAEELMRQDGL